MLIPISAGRRDKHPLLRLGILRSGALVRADLSMVALIPGPHESLLTHPDDVAAALLEA